ncbi:MAG: hypothetical protein ACLSGI_09850 [Butyricicoccaceae bacterium]
MNQYKRLLGNTFIFAIGTFSSKILVILMLRFYTGMMTQDEMGVADLIIKTTSILYPVVSLSIGQAVIRYGLERKFTSAVAHCACDRAVRLYYRTAVPSAAESHPL